MRGRSEGADKSANNRRGIKGQTHTQGTRYEVYSLRRLTLILTYTYGLQLCQALAVRDVLSNLLAGVAHIHGKKNIFLRYSSARRKTRA